MLTGAPGQVFSGIARPCRRQPAPVWNRAQGLAAEQSDDRWVGAPEAHRLRDVAKGEHDSDLCIAEESEESGLLGPRDHRVEEEVQSGK